MSDAIPRGGLGLGMRAKMVSDLLLERTEVPMVKDTYEPPGKL